MNYFECGSAKTREYLIFTIKDGNYDYEVVRY